MLRSADRRRRLLVEGFQGNFLIATLLGFGAQALACVLVLFAPLVFDLLDPAQPERDLVRSARALLWLHATIWPALAVMLCVALLQALRITHRIAGPLYRFRQVYKSAAAGDFAQRVRIRRGDFLTLDAAALEAMLEACRSRIAEAQSEARALEATLDQLTTGPADAAALRRAHGKAQDLVAALAHFRTDPSAPPLPGAPASAAVPEPAARGWLRRLKRTRGFTLVELLVAIGTIITVSALAIPRLNAALQRARTTAAIADIRGFDLEIRLFYMQQGRYPNTLAEVHPQVELDPWGRPYVYVMLDIRPGSKNGKGSNGAKARKDRFLHPLNTDYDLYSMGPDGQTNLPLTAKQSRDDIVRANNGGFVGVAADY